MCIDLYFLWDGDYSCYQEDFMVILLGVLGAVNIMGKCACAD